MQKAFNRALLSSSESLYNKLESKKSFTSIAPSSPTYNITFYASSLDEFYYVPDKSLHPSSGWDDQRLALIDLIMACKPYSEDINLTVKLHPHAVQKSSEQRRAWEFLKAFSNIHVVGLAEGKELSTDDLIQQSHLNFVFHSTVGAEIIASGKKAFTFSSTAYDYLFDCITISTYDELWSIIESNIKNFSCPKALFPTHGQIHLSSVKLYGNA